MDVSIDIVRLNSGTNFPWWRHQMETFSALLARCAGNSTATGEFPSQRSVTRNFDVFFDLCLNKRFSKQSWVWWFETPSRLLWRHCNVFVCCMFTTCITKDRPFVGISDRCVILINVCSERAPIVYDLLTFSTSVYHTWTRFHTLGGVWDSSIIGRLPVERSSNTELRRFLYCSL